MKLPQTEEINVIVWPGLAILNHFFGFVDQLALSPIKSFLQVAFGWAHSARIDHLR